MIRVQRNPGLPDIATYTVEEKTRDPCKGQVISAAVCEKEKAVAFFSDLSNYEYLGRHDKVGRAVGSRLFDAGALEETTFQKLVKKGVPIRAIATFSNSTRPWVGRAGMEPEVQQALRQALLAWPIRMRCARCGSTASSRAPIPIMNRPARRSKKTRNSSPGPVSS